MLIIISILCCSVFLNRKKSNRNKKKIKANRCCTARSSSSCNELAIANGVSVSNESIANGSVNRILRRLLSSAGTSFNEGITSG